MASRNEITIEALDFYADGLILLGCVLFFVALICALPRLVGKITMTDRNKIIIEAINVYRDTCADGLYDVARDALRAAGKSAELTAPEETLIEDEW